MWMRCSGRRRSRGQRIDACGARRLGRGDPSTTHESRMTSSPEFDEETRALLMSASRVITKHGLDAFTLDLLAKEANVPLAEVTRRFPDRKKCLHDLVLIGMFD